MRAVTFEDTMTPLGAAVVVMGVFDGVHIGHQALVRDAARDADARGCPAVALTFDRDPDQVTSPRSAAPQLLSVEDKCAYLGDAGADTVLVVPFDARVAGMSPARFVDEVVLVALDPVAIHVGADFRFGRSAAGDVGALSRLGSARGFTVAGHTLVTADDSPVTSTRIRALVARGDLAAASDLLGRAHRVSGRVVRGRGEGSALLGIPTANIAPAPYSAVPPHGVYAGHARVEERWFPAGISVGAPPTFPEARDVLEAHLIGFDGEVRGSAITVTFIERIRDQEAFDDPAALALAIHGDLERAHAIATRRGPS